MCVLEREREGREGGREGETEREGGMERGRYSEERERAKRSRMSGMIS